MPLTLPDVFAGVHALEYPISSGAIIDYSLRGEPPGCGSSCRMCVRISVRVRARFRFRGRKV